MLSFDRPSWECHFHYRCEKAYEGGTDYARNGLARIAGDFGSGYNAGIGMTFYFRQIQCSIGINRPQTRRKITNRLGNCGVNLAADPSDRHCRVGQIRTCQPQYIGTDAGHKVYHGTAVKHADNIIPMPNRSAESGIRVFKLVFGV